MKKIFIILTFLFLILQLPVLANESYFDNTDLGDIMKYTNSVENGFSGQKHITDEEFEKTLEKIKAKQKKKDKTIPKGKIFNDKDDGIHIDITSEKNILLSVPLELINGGGEEIPAGHYKIIGEKENQNVYLNFYQSSTLIAKVPAIETESDFGKTDINFAELTPYNKQRVKIIFGSTDFNAYTFIRIKNEISD